MKMLTKTDEMILYELQKRNEPVKAEFLAQKLRREVRSIRYHLKKLIEAELVTKEPDLFDLRGNYYQTTNKSYFPRYVSITS